MQHPGHFSRARARTSRTQRRALIPLRRSGWILAASVATVLVVGALGSGIAAATSNAEAANDPPALAVPCPQLTGPTKPGTCPTGPTGPLQKQVDFLTTTVNYYKKTATKFSSGSVGPANAIDYGLESLWEQGIDGNGVTVAVMEEWNIPATSRSALKKMSTTDHLPTLTSLGLLTTLYPTGPLPTTETITENTDHGKYKTADLTETASTKLLCPEGMIKLGSYGSCSAWEGELELDIEAVHMFAPYAHIVISATPADSQITDSAAFNVAAPELIHAVAYIAANHIANVISISDGTTETSYAGLATLNAQNISELTAAADGVPVLVATGDCGVVQNLASANGQCSTGSSTPETAAWDDSPWITAVGGSVEHITKGVKTANDTGWPTSGAGYSAVYARPAYQNAVAKGAPMRSVPDLVMDSASGTSEAAPSFNGVLALATQLNGGKDLGPIQTALYKIGPEGAAAGIIDVTTGNDSRKATKTKAAVAGFHAGTGFDVDTGWGTVTADKFVFSLDQETNLLDTESAARAQAASDISALEQVQLTPRGSATNLLGQNFIPKHPVNLYVTGSPVTTLTATALGDVTYTITPSALGLAAGPHTVTLTSLLVTESGTFIYTPGAETTDALPPPPGSSPQRLLLMPTKLSGVAPGSDTYLLGQGLSPGASVNLYVTSTLVTTLTGGQGSTKGVPGDVTYMITPSALGLLPGIHTVTLTSPTVVETGKFAYEAGAADKGANLSGQALAGATLAGATLQTATLALANLQGANLTDADCQGANFSGANLQGANLTEADCEAANFTGANLEGTDFTRATTSTANFSKDSTTTTVTESDASAFYTHEHTAVFGVTVTSHIGEAVPTGETVTIHVGSASCTATLTAGAGSCPIPAGSLLPGGPYAVSASYGGDTDLIGSTSTNKLTFSVTATTVTVTVTGTNTYGSTNPSFTYTATPSVTLTGTVTCADVGTNTPIVSTPPLGAGTHTVNGTSCSGLSATGYTVTYSGKTNGFVVSKDSTTTAVTESKASAPYTHQYTAVFGVTVTTHTGEAGPSGEKVTIHVGSASCTAPLTEGSGTCQIPAGSLRVGGPYAVSASFGGDTNLTGSASTNKVTFSVSAATFGYWIVSTNGIVHNFGAGVTFGSLPQPSPPKPGSPPAPPAPPAAPVVGIAATPDGGGYWLAEANGTVVGFGDAASGSKYCTGGICASLTPTPGPAGQIVGIAADPASPWGYWLVSQSGTVTALSGALGHGSLPKATPPAPPAPPAPGFAPLGPGSPPAAPAAPAAPVVGIAATPDGGGYWLAEANGTVVGFGDAASGSKYCTGGICASLTPTPGPAGQIVGIAADPASPWGYWLVSQSGTVTALSGALGHGSLPKATPPAPGFAPLGPGSPPPPPAAPAAPVVGIAATPDGNGYWLVEANGTVVAFGDATTLGSAPQAPGPSGQVVGVAEAP